MKKGSISLDEYMKATKRLEKMLLEANELLRSAYAIAQRNGEKTNWEAFRGQLKKALDAQHESGLTQPAPDAGESSPLQALSTPEHSATSQNLSTPTQRG